MKFRFTLGILAVAFALVVGFGVTPAHAQAAELSATDRANMQTALDLTEATLDIIQVQINQNQIQDRQSTLTTLSGIRAYLLNMQAMLGGSPVAMLIEEPEPVAPRPTVAVAPIAEPATPATPVAPEAPGEVAGSAVISETETVEEPTATSPSTSSRRAFWIILITAIIIAIILAIPRKEKEIVILQDTPPQPKPVDADKSETVQSA